MDIGKTIQKLRIEKGISQEKLARECGLSRTYIGMLESNLRDGKLSTMIEIGKVLGVPYPYILVLAMEEGDVPKRFATIHQEILKIIEG